VKANIALKIVNNSRFHPLAIESASASVIGFVSAVSGRAIRLEIASIRNLVSTLVARCNIIPFYTIRTLPARSGPALITRW
jgi:hypothetical protein